MFCAGLDLNEIPLLSDHEMGHFLQRLMDIYGAMMQTSFPIVAAIDGPAIAGGFELALMCDIRLASPKAKFGIPEISIGIPPCIDPLWKIVGMGRARELAMTGMIFDAQEAYRMGLVNRLIPSEEIFDKALDLARELAEKDPAAMGAIKQNCRMIPGMETLQALKAQDWVTKNFLDTQQKRQRMLDYIKQLGAQKS